MIPGAALAPRGRVLSERHWFVLGLFTLSVLGGYLFVVKTEPVPAASSVAALPPGSLMIETDPTGATAQIDGRGERFVTPIQIDRLSGGKHTVTLSLDGFTSETREITARGAAPTSLVVTLSRR